jgi:protein-S-isoprenylcysteine O-methyltransferase Ste14
MAIPALQYIIVGAGTALLLVFSRRCILDARAHGFYRFFAFEAILIVFVLNMPFWFDDPFSLRQMCSWVLLCISAGLALHGFRMLKMVGRPVAEPHEGTDFAFEQTVHLVTSGVYRFIRHPLYASLLFLAWGAFLKHIDPATVVLALATSVFVFLTARVEERENLRRFGEAYRTYMHHTRMFVPLVL